MRVDRMEGFFLAGKNSRAFALLRLRRIKRHGLAELGESAPRV